MTMYPPDDRSATGLGPNLGTDKPEGCYQVKVQSSSQGRQGKEHQEGLIKREVVTLSFAVYMEFPGPGDCSVRKVLATHS